MELVRIFFSILFENMLGCIMPVCARATSREQVHTLPSTLSFLPPDDCTHSAYVLLAPPGGVKQLCYIFNLVSGVQY